MDNSDIIEEKENGLDTAEAEKEAAEKNNITSEEDDRGDYYSQLAKADLTALRTSFRELRSLGDISELENPVKFARLRDEGLSAVEAYLECRKIKKTYDNRSHLHSSLPLSRTRDEGSMSKDELIAARELFPDISDAEIQKLYKSVTRQ